jgi:DNA-binding protein HU-beta
MAAAKSRSRARGKSKRTTHRSTSGTKVYAKRSASGRFEDVQTFERAHERDIKRRSRAEVAKKKGKRKTGTR